VLHPILATAAIHGWLVEDPPGLLDSFNIDASNMLEMGVPTKSESNEEAWPAINRCLHAMCALIYGNHVRRIFGLGSSWYGVVMSHWRDLSHEVFIMM
jgi:hypothetical protein